MYKFILSTVLKTFYLIIKCGTWGVLLLLIQIVNAQNITSTPLLDAANYAQSQLGSNAVVLGMGVLAGSGDPIAFDEAFSSGPLAAINRVIGILRDKRTLGPFAWENTVNVADDKFSHFSKGMIQQIIKNIICIGLTIVVWAWAGATGAADRWLLIMGLGCGAFDLVARFIILAMCAWCVTDDIRCLCTYGGRYDPNDFVGPNDKHYNTRLHRQRLRDYVVNYSDGKIAHRPNGASRDVRVPPEAVRTDLFARLETQGHTWLFKAVHVFLDVVLICWWLIVMSGPAVYDSAWWPVLLCFFIAAGQSKIYDFTGTVWARGKSAVDTQRVAAMATILQAMGDIWIGEFRTSCNVGSIFANAATMTCLTDGWTMGREVNIEVATADATQIWNEVSQLDPSLRKALLIAGSDHNTSRVSTFSDSLSELARRIILIGDHMIDCPKETLEMTNGGLESNLSVRVVLCVLSAGHECNVIKQGHEWLENWVIQHWWLITSLGDTIGMGTMNSHEMRTALNGTDFSSIMRRVMCIALSPSHPLTLSQLVILMLNQWCLNGQSILSVGPHVSAFNLWVNSLDVHVTTGEGRIDLECAGHVAVIRTAFTPLAEELPIEVGTGTYRVSGETQALASLLQSARLRCGLSKAIIGMETGWIQYPWMTIEEAAEGSGTASAEVGRQRRKIAKDKLKEVRELRIRQATCES
jgi:hypothetical protein